jgi:hypothetical protein
LPGVWRLGAAGRTASAGDGTFALIDATRNSPDPESGLGRAPVAVTLVAVKDDRWGFLNVDSTNPPKPMAIVLDQQGYPPTPPRMFNWKGSFATNQAEFFTARWRSSNHKDLGIRLVLPNKSVQDPGGNGIGQCVGDCSGFSNAGLVVALPRGVSFSIQAWNNAVDAPEPSPDWDEAEVVSR